MRVNLNTARPATLAAVIGKATTVDLYDGTATGIVESVVNGRAVVRFGDGRWAYSKTRLTVD